jgi:hypothetical protein
MAITEKEGVGTEKPIVVQSLHHRYTFVLGYVIGSGRDKGKSVVEVDYMRSVSPNKFPQLARDSSVPQGGSDKGQRSHVLYTVIVHRVADNTVSMGFLQDRFSRKGLIFATGLLIVVVNQ